jgi:hypothetical protein
MRGFPEHGAGLPMRVEIGPILTTTTMTAAGNTMRVIGTTMITMTIMIGITTTIATNLSQGPAE